MRSLTHSAPRLVSLAAGAIALACTAGCTVTTNGTSGSGGSGGTTTSGAPTTSSGPTTTGSMTTSTSTSGGPGVTTSVTSGGGDTEPAEMTGMTAAHNAVRASVNPPANPAIPPLSWSSQVASVAQAYAQNCVFQHSGGSYGENLFASTGNSTPQEVVQDWASEVSSYDYANDSCSGVCGHYTQVVWRDSVHLGCGMANCTTNSPFGGGAWQLWVCNYNPPGNYIGQKPY